MRQAASRAVVSDNGTIWLTAYGENGAVVAVTLTPVRAVALAGELIRAAVPKLNVTASPPKRRRGGDPHAEKRRELHDGLCAMALLLGLGKGKSALDVAQEITDRCARYQPMPLETDPLRREMQRVRNTGLSIPKSARHIVRVISPSDIQ